MPTEQERPGMYARTPKAPSRLQHGPADDQVANLRQAHQMSWDNNVTNSRISTESLRLRSVARQGLPDEKKRRLNLQTFEDTPVTGGPPESLLSHHVSPPACLLSAEPQVPYPRHIVANTLHTPSRHLTEVDIAPTVQHRSTPSCADSAIEDFTDSSKFEHSEDGDQEGTEICPTTATTSAFQWLSLNLPTGPSLHEMVIEGYGYESNFENPHQKKTPECHRRDGGLSDLDSAWIGQRYTLGLEM
jgi:hypothetical protein